MNPIASIFRILIKTQINMKSLLSCLFTLLYLSSFSQTQSKYIIVDQFGYRPDSEKIAVMRDPLTGFDAAESFAPGFNYAVVDVSNGTQVLTGNATPYKSGAEDSSSGDRAWWFDFSALQTPGTYYILDINKNLKSYDFIIADNVYEELLKHAVRTFYYQRAGYAKAAQYAGAKWADGASHLGNLQDTQCRKYDAPNSVSTERDLSGGWYDAGDYNKYTPWTSNYIVDMIRAYKANPDAFGDDYNLPYSGNSIPDLVDEIKWGLDFLLKLQESDGSLISVVSLSHASPPSSATGPSLYGGVNTTSALAAASAYAFGAKLYSELGDASYSNTLLQSAISAWNWAVANPSVIWENNVSGTSSEGIGAGQQETNEYGRLAYKIRAAVYLFDATGNNDYKTFVDNNYSELTMIKSNFVFPFEEENQEALLYYASLTNATTSVASNINSVYNLSMNSTDNFTAFNNEVDPYLAHLKDYVWGSNNTKSRKGLLFTDYVKYDINTANNDDALRAAERYIHYLHGVNPLNFCYLSNMYDYGADNGVNEFYHAWFADGTDWDNVQDDLYGPAPGYVVGGANPTYDWDGCCPSGCSGNVCDPAQVSRIKGQPKQKAYDDFNTSWPMNSWSVTENSCSYQLGYIRLLSKFVNINGPLSAKKFNTNTVSYYPNPFKDKIRLEASKPFTYQIYNLVGQKVSNGACDGSCYIGQNIKTKGVYFIKINTESKVQTIKVIKQ